MAWGDEKVLDTLYAHYEKTGVMPPALENIPVLFPWNEPYLEAFYTLSPSRQNTDHVINPISFTDVVSYCDCIGIHTGEAKLLFWKFVSYCDQAFIVNKIEKMTQEIKAMANNK